MSGIIWNVACTFFTFSRHVTGGDNNSDGKDGNLKTRVRGWEIFEMAHGDWTIPENGVQSAE